MIIIIIIIVIIIIIMIPHNTICSSIVYGAKPYTCEVT